MSKRTKQRMKRQKAERQGRRWATRLENALPRWTLEDFGINLSDQDSVYSVIQARCDFWNRKSAELLSRLGKSGSDV